MVSLPELLQDFPNICRRLGRNGDRTTIKKDTSLNEFPEVISSRETGLYLSNIPNLNRRISVSPQHDNKWLQSQQCSNSAVTKSDTLASSIDLSPRNYFFYLRLTDEGEAKKSHEELIYNHNASRISGGSIYTIDFIWDILHQKRCLLIFDLPMISRGTKIPPIVAHVWGKKGMETLNMQL